MFRLKKQAPRTKFPRPGLYGARFPSDRAAIVVSYRDGDQDCQILRRSRRCRLACRDNDSGLRLFPHRLWQSSWIVRSIGPDQPRGKLRVPLPERSWNDFLVVIQEICCHAKNIPPPRLINYLDAEPTQEDQQRGRPARRRAGRETIGPVRLSAISGLGWGMVQTQA
jgi:hypothetical protein